MNLESIQGEIRKAGLDGWLFFDHHERDPHEKGSIRACVQNRIQLLVGNTAGWVVAAQGSDSQDEGAVYHVLDRGSAMFSLPQARFDSGACSDSLRRCAGLNIEH